jgi:hypothetical protein
MGGKSRKSGGVSKKLIESLKRGNQFLSPKKETKDPHEKSRENFNLLGTVEKEED